MAPVAAEIMPGRPPTNAMMTAIQNDAYRPTFGSTPAMIEKAIASGINARATTIPESRSPRIFEHQFCLSAFTMVGDIQFYKEKRNRYQAPPGRARANHRKPAGYAGRGQWTMHATLGRKGRNGSGNFDL